ncbi:FadR/GntR family transcriptional regulator [Alloalcanivorax xenomutans]|uniref:FCD domain-containing protein n=1 Tax=Alloalcanivorax xenomutans TaxID=1094342 RepID=A0A9Q3ZGD0_9GAMM|nr:FCD domain-containing protein [Alloalcanivorax xenomutans]ARB47167.1 hypothetical protein P40_18625 [Alloalcanivorax xenomutans]MCE7510811.1 FCD domain-containing protein [Alloalcanivorax xenomutans]MCE7525326.1 FCD domain-containing protein [Alloalcanivorax xenomutans]
MTQRDHQFAKLKRPPAYKVVADELIKAIAKKTLRPGDLLPIEGELAEQFGVNRSTVREGIRYLEQSGLVTRKGKRLMVSRPSYQVLADQFCPALIVHDVSFLELWTVTLELEPLAARLASEKATPEILATLEANLNDTKAALARGDDLVQLDIEFHELLAEAADNKALSISRSALARLFYPAYRTGMFPETSGERLVMAHEIILNAIREHDTERATEWMYKHMVDFKRGYELAGLDVLSPLPWREE